MARRLQVVEVALQVVVALPTGVVEEEAGRVRRALCRASSKQRPVKVACRKGRVVVAPGRPEQRREEAEFHPAPVEERRRRWLSTPYEPRLDPRRRDPRFF